MEKLKSYINITFKAFMLIWLVEIVILFGELVKVIFIAQYL